MSSRRHDYSKGSSSSRDDFRRHKERDHGRRRSRSRSPRRHSPDDRNSYKNEEYQPKRKWSGDSPREGEEVPAPPPPPRITKISIGFNKPKKAPIKIKLGEGSKVTSSGPIKKASVFEDDDDEPEEMPAEARMRMRNIGRETPTSAGPNSFGKTKQGFCDAKKVFEKNLKEALDTAERTPAGTFKLPQTIYKIQP